VSRPKHAERVYPGQPGISRTKGAHVANPQQTKANRIPRHRVDPAVTARRAGDRGRHAQPMETGHRVQAYERQTGKPELTPKQRRRANSKLRRIHLADAAATP
jgi:hypothetical protein